MKRRHLLCSVLVLIVMMIIFIVFSNKKKNSTGGSQLPKELETTSNSRKTQSIPRAENTVNFSDFEPLNYTKIETTTLGKLAKKHHYYEKVIYADLDIQIFTDDNDRILKITRHAGHYKSVSRRSEVRKELEKHNRYIKKLGNELLYISNRDIMVNIIYMFEHEGFTDFKFKDHLDDKTEIEIIPFTFISTNPNARLPLNTEIPGLLWNHKRDYIWEEWKEDERFRSIRLEDYITSHWSLYPIETPVVSDHDPRFSRYVIDTGKAVGAFLPELRVTGE